MGMAAILVMWPGRFEQTFVLPSQGGSIWNLVSIGLVVSEEKMFENVDIYTYTHTHTHGPKRPTYKKRRKREEKEEKLGIKSKKKKKSVRIFFLCAVVIFLDQSEIRYLE